jgi:hypothetical protein
LENKKCLISNEVLSGQNSKQYPLETCVVDNDQQIEYREPVVVGNETLCIFNHKIFKFNKIDDTLLYGVSFDVKNISELTIGCAIFKITLFNKDNHIIDEVEEKKYELLPDKINNIRIYTKSGESVGSYDISIIRTTIAPTPLVVGNDKVSILKHDIALVNNFPHSKEWKEIDLVIRNISTVNIANLTIEAIFYDIEGNIIDNKIHEEYDLLINTSRTVCIIPNETNFTPGKYHYKDIWSYSVKIIEMKTSDIQRIRIKWHNRKTVGYAIEEINGLVKNICNFKTDAAVTATFYNIHGDKLGTKVMLLRDLEPGSVRNFNICYTPPNGQNVQSYLLST